jgi:hypothetical protein
MLCEARYSVMHGFVLRRPAAGDEPRAGGLHTVSWPVMFLFFMLLPSCTLHVSGTNPSERAFISSSGTRLRRTVHAAAAPMSRKVGIVGVGRISRSSLLGLKCMGGDSDKDSKDRSADSPFARREFLAATLAPLASVSAVYLALPSLLSEETRAADWYKRSFASRMEGLCVRVCVCARARARV